MFFPCNVYSVFLSIFMHVTPWILSLVSGNVGMFAMFAMMVVVVMVAVMFDDGGGGNGGADGNGEAFR